MTFTNDYYTTYLLIITKDQIIKAVPKQLFKKIPVTCTLVTDPFHHQAVARVAL